MNEHLLAKWRTLAGHLMPTVRNCECQWPFHIDVWQAMLGVAEAGPRRWLLACSGGADSVAMAGLCIAAAAELDCEVALAHFNHGWRGEEAEADAGFVQNLAEQWGIPFFFAKAEKGLVATETAARSARLAFLRNTAANWDAGAICFGHQRDDVAESLLLRIARGAGTEGLAAPRPVHHFRDGPSHWRPLLNLSSHDLRSALAAEGVSWRDDSSNTDERHARNFLRHRILPDLNQPPTGTHSFTDGAARTRHLLEEDADALENLTRARLPQAFADSDSMPVADLLNQPKALVRRALLAFISSRCEGRLPVAEEMDSLVDQISRKSLSGEGWVCNLPSSSLWIEGNRFVWRPASASGSRTVEMENCVPLALSSAIEWGEASIAASPVAITPTLWSRIEAGEIDPAKEAYLSIGPDVFPLTVRTRRPGDRYHPLGAPGGKKLKDILIDLKIPRAERSHLPIVATKEGEILWVPRLPPSEPARVKPETRSALRLTYQRTCPLLNESHDT